MKTRSVFMAVVAVALAAMFQSCLHSEEDYTPFINASSPVRNGADTLSWTINETNGAYLFDTIQIGDTVRYVVAFGSYANNLVAFKADWDKNALVHEFQINDTIAQILTEESNVEQCELYFQSGYNGVVFPITVTPKMEGETTIKYTVESDSKYATSNIIFSFYTKGTREFAD